MNETNETRGWPPPDIVEQRDRLVALREALVRERAQAMSPAVERALGLADIYLFLALSYFGFTDRLFPEER